MSRIRKLGVGIVAFEGTEHLKNITYALRENVEHIMVCLQKESYWGNPIQQEDVDEVDDLIRCGLVDDVVYFEPTDRHEDKNEQAARYIECDKRNFIVDQLALRGCSHHIVIDSDEYYDPEDFAEARRRYDGAPCKASYCEYVNYYRDYRHILVWPMRVVVPFIADIDKKFKYAAPTAPAACDLTRRLDITREDNPATLEYELVKMHHLSWIRKDIRKKIRNWSSRECLRGGAEAIEERAYERYVNFTDSDNAILCILTKNNEVMVQKLRRQFIRPMYALDEKPEPYRR